MMKQKVIVSLAILLWVSNLHAISINFCHQFSDSIIHLQDTTHTLSPDTIPKSEKDSLLINSLADSLAQADLLKQKGETVRGLREIPDQIKNRSIAELLSVKPSNLFYNWKFNNSFLSNEFLPTDTALWMDHLIYPQQLMYETFTYLGTYGSPLQMDHFFSRDTDFDFLFTRHLNSYSTRAIDIKHYNVRTPFTRLYYSSAGAKSEAEQTFRILHTQNVNKHLNFGFTYDFYGTKGVYENQETRNNVISLFSSYYKSNFSLQGSFVNRVLRQEENGGITDHYFIQDTLVETKFVPIWLGNASSISRERQISIIAGYTFVNIKQYKKDSLGKHVDNYLPLMTAKLIFNHDRYSRSFVNNTPNDEYFTNFFITPTRTRDSVFLQNFDAKAMLEIAQFAKIPGMPGLRGWLGYTNRVYDFYKPENFIYANKGNRDETVHFGVAAFSESRFISYQGAIRLYFKGYKADDKIIEGELRFSPWRSDNFPQLLGRIQISELTPDIFLNNYFSNHFMWNNSFEKEKRFSLSGVLESKGLQASVGYNLIHIKDYLYFNQNARPSQTSDVTITSAYIQKNFKIGRGLNVFNKVLWQVNTNTDVLSLPQFIAFSSVFYEAALVKNVLTGQFGFSVFYRTEFYADAYQPATGQFYNQRTKLIGNYPVADVFANFKWKRAILFFKIDHVNQGYPNNQYFATSFYPMNPLVFKFGVSWTFYD
jgi:hypothetical protein